MSGLILLAGDTHGDLPQIHYLLKIAQGQGIKRIVQVGDFGYWPHVSQFHEDVNDTCAEAGVEMYWLDGNHENFDALERDVDTTADAPQQMLSHLWYLPRACTWTWGGCRFMALGGAYSIDKHQRVEGVSWWPQELITARQAETAMTRGPVDVLLTHDAPEGVVPIIDRHFKGDEISRGNRLAISAVAEAAHPRLLVHGHYHHRYSARVGATQVEGLDRDGTGADSWLMIDLAMWATEAAA